MWTKYGQYQSETNPADVGAALIWDDVCVALDICTDQDHVGIRSVRLSEDLRVDAQKDHNRDGWGSSISTIPLHIQHSSTNTS